MSWKGRIQTLQVARRGVQVLALAFLLLAPAAARYSSYLASGKLDARLDQWRGRSQGAVLAAFDAVLRAIPGGEEERRGALVRDRDRCLDRARALRGGPWSAQVGPLSMTDPLAAAESIAASRSLLWVLLASAALPLLLTVVLGRVFCSWVCPVGFLLELTDKLRRALRFLRITPAHLRFSRAVKYALLLAGLLMTALLSLPLLGTIYPPAVLGREAHGFVFAYFDAAEHDGPGFGLTGLSVMSGFLLAIALFEIAFSRRWWCRVMCPGGAAYSLLGALRLVRVRRRAASCTSCGDCNAHCPMGLAPMNDLMGVECDSCGVCISVCGDDALHYRITSPQDFKKVEPLEV